MRFVIVPSSSLYVQTIPVPTFPTARDSRIDCNTRSALSKDIHEDIVPKMRDS